MYFMSIKLFFFFTLNTIGQKMSLYICQRGLLSPYYLSNFAQVIINI